MNNERIILQHPVQKCPKQSEMNYFVLPTRTQIKGIYAGKNGATTNEQKIQTNLIKFYSTKNNNNLWLS